MYLESNPPGDPWGSEHSPVFSRGIHAQKEVVFVGYWEIPLYLFTLDGWSVCNFCTVFEEKVQYNSNRGQEWSPPPLFLTLLIWERGKKCGWHHGRDDDSRENVVDYGLWWNVNIKLFVAFAAWQIHVVKAPVHAPGAQAPFGIRDGAFPSQIVESVWKLV